MLDVLGHIAALEVLRARLEDELASGSVSDPRAAAAHDALVDCYPFAVLGAILDHLLAHAGASDAEVALLEEATGLYAALEAFVGDFRALRAQIERIAQDPQAPGTLSAYNAARWALGDLFDRHARLHADLNAYARKLGPPSHLVQHPRAFDVPAADWPWRDLVLGRRTGVLAATVARFARDDGRPEALALAVGVLAGHAGNLVGSPYLAHGVSGPRRSHPYRDRLAAYAVGAWTRAARPALPLSFEPLRGVPAFGSPDAPALPDWTVALLARALDETYGADVAAAPPDLQAAYAQLLDHWRLLQAFSAFSPQAPVPVVLEERIANTLEPGELHTLGGGGGPTPPGGGTPPSSAGSSSIIDPGPGQPPWFRPAHHDAVEWIAEICTDILLLPLFLIRVGAWLWHEGESSEPDPSTPVGSIKAKLQTPVAQGDLDAATAYADPASQGKAILIAVSTLAELDAALQSVATDCLRIMKVVGLLYPDRGELANLEFRQFLVLPHDEAGFVWPARPPAAVEAFVQPPAPPVEAPQRRPSRFPAGEKPIAFLRPGIGGAPSMAREGFDLVLAELLERDDSPVRARDPDLDADRGDAHDCWAPAPGTSIHDDPVDVAVLGYGEL